MCMCPSGHPARHVDPDPAGAEGRGLGLCIPNKPPGEGPQVWGDVCSVPDWTFHSKALISPDVGTKRAEPQEEA